MELDLAIEIALGLGERRAGLGGLQPKLAIIENREQLTGFHVVAFLDEDAADFAADLRDDFRVRFGFESGGAAVHREHLAANGLGDFDGDGGVGERLGVLFLGGLVAGDAVFAQAETASASAMTAARKRAVCHDLPLCLRL